MAAYRGSEAYDFSLFEPQVTSVRSNAAPARKNVPSTRPAPKKAEKAVPKKTADKDAFSRFEHSVKREAKSVALPSSVVKAAAALLAFCGMWIGLLVMQAQSETITTEISEYQDKLDILEGEKVRLTAELNSKMSSEKIEKYAVDELGMVKAESYQISYIDLSEGDEVVVSGGKSVSNGSFMLKVKDFFAYIF